MQIIRGPIQSAQRVVIYGPEGIGKSTLASKFPNPLFIDTEGSTKQLDVARTPTPTSWAMLLQQVDYVINHPTICDTLVIDTADWAEKLCLDALLAKYNKGGIEEFGYGKGYVYLEEEFGRFLNRLNDVIEKGVHVVLVAHAHARKFELPGEAGAFDKWELKLLKRNAPLVKEWADMVLFANYKLHVVNVDGQGAEKGRNIAQGGKRVIYTTHNPAWDAKNRHNLPDEIDMDYSAIAHCFPPRGAVSAPSAQLAASATQSAPEPTPEPEPVAQSASEAVPAPAKESGTAPEAAEVDELEAAGVPRALADLMRSAGVTLADVQQVVAQRGYFPADTPFRNYPPDFVEGVLIGAWDQVLAAIKESQEYVPF